MFLQIHQQKKKKAKEILHPLLDARGNIANKDEEKAEVLHAFFTSVFISQTSYSQGTLSPLLMESRINLP